MFFQVLESLLSDVYRCLLCGFFRPDGHQAEDKQKPTKAHSGTRAHLQTRFSRKREKKENTLMEAVGADIYVR